MLAFVFLIALTVSVVSLAKPVSAQTLGPECETDADCGPSTEGLIIRCEAIGASGTRTCVDRTPRRGTIPEVVEYDSGNVAGAAGQANQAFNIDNTLKFLQAGVYRSVFNPDGTGLAQSMTKAIASMYAYPPATTKRYVAYVLDSAHIVPQAYAQGLGFSSLSPVLDAWRTFRNIAYFFFVLIFLVIGFMIMFRYRIGQTAITAQQAIPRIIIALLTVTFSYAIAGLLVDVMYLVMFLLIGVFGVSQSDFLTVGPVELGAALITGGGEAGSRVAEEIVNSLLGGGVAANALGVISGLTAGVVIAVTIAIGIFRVFFSLLRTYVSLIVSIATAPVVLMLGAIPGRNVFKPWFMSLVGNLSAFPIVLIFLILFDKLTGGITGGSASVQQGGFTPPYLFGVSGAGIIPLALGLGGLLVLEKIIEEGKKAMGAKGGLFEQYAGALSDSVKRGWKGGELIPGIGATNLAKYGLSGQSIARTGAVAAGTGAGALAGAQAYATNRLFRRKGHQLSYEALERRARMGGRVAADTLGSKFYKEGRDERKKVPIYDVQRRVQGYQAPVPKK